MLVKIFLLKFNFVLCKRVLEVNKVLKTNVNCIILTLYNQDMIDNAD